MAGRCGRLQKSRRRISDGELLAVLDAWLAGRSLRLIAIDLFGEERVAKEWFPNGWMRARVRYRLDAARVIERERGAGGEVRHDGG